MVGLVDRGHDGKAKPHTGSRSARAPRSGWHRPGRTARRAAPRCPDRSPARCSPPRTRVAALARTLTQIRPPSTLCRIALSSRLVTAWVIIVGSPRTVACSQVCSTVRPAAAIRSASESLDLVDDLGEIDAVLGRRDALPPGQRQQRGRSADRNVRRPSARSAPPVAGRPVPGPAPAGSPAPSLRWSTGCEARERRWPRTDPARRRPTPAGPAWRRWCRRVP